MGCIYDTSPHFGPDKQEFISRNEIMHFNTQHRYRSLKQYLYCQKFDFVITVWVLHAQAQCVSTRMSWETQVLSGIQELINFPKFLE